MDNKQLTTEEMKRWEAAVDEEIRKYLARKEQEESPNKEDHYNILLRD